MNPGRDELLGCLSSTGRRVGHHLRDCLFCGCLMVNHRVCRHPVDTVMLYECLTHPPVRVLYDYHEFLMRNRWLQHDLVPFDIYELTESVPHFNQVRSVFHDNIDILVSPGCLVQEGARVTPFYPCHGSLKLTHGDVLLRGTTRIVPACPVGRGVQSQGIPLAFHHVGCCSHAPRDESHDPEGSVDSPFPGHPHFLSLVNLLHRVVVVALDYLGLLYLVPDPFLETPDDPAHHPLAIQLSELLSPAQVPDVIPEFPLVFRQVREVPVGERLALA